MLYISNYTIIPEIIAYNFMWIYDLYIIYISFFNLAKAFI